MLSALFLKIADDVFEFEFEFGKEEAIRSRTRFVEVELGKVLGIEVELGNGLGIEVELGNGLGIEVELGWDLRIEEEEENEDESLCRGLSTCNEL